MHILINLKLGANYNRYISVTSNVTSSKGTSRDLACCWLVVSGLDHRHPPERDTPAPAVCLPGGVVW